MTRPPVSAWGPRIEKGSEWRAPASASKASVVSSIRENGVDVRRDEPGQIVERPVQRQDLAEPRSADRQVPAVAALRTKQAQLPLLEPRAPSPHGRLDGAVQPG